MEWTKRQQRYAENWKAETVYTPAFVLDGSEWRNATVPVVNDETPGVLKAVVRDDATVIVTFEPATGAVVAAPPFGVRLIHEEDDGLPPPAAASAADAVTRSRTATIDPWRAMLRSI